MLRQRRRRQLGALLEAQLEVNATRIVLAFPRRRIDVVLHRAGELARALIQARVLVEEDPLASLKLGTQLATGLSVTSKVLLYQP